MAHDGDNLHQRKLEHLDIVLKREVEPVVSSFDSYRLPYRALPEVDFSQIDASCTFFDKQLAFPFLISSMTGGPLKAGHINRNLAIAAQEVGVALGLGSMRVLLESPDSVESFNVRHLCPDVPIFANLGLVQLNYGCGLDEVQRLVDMVEADGIFLHVNPLQEVIQPEGDTNFKGLLRRLEAIVPKLSVPIVVKEVGAGMDKGSAQKLMDVGIRWIDASGTGGTSWAAVEGFRRDDRLGSLFQDVGLPTSELLRSLRDFDDLHLIGSGGVRSGVDVAKALILGAEMVGAAKPFLASALDSAEACVALLREWLHEFKVAMFCCGVTCVEDLHLLELAKK